MTRPVVGVTCCDRMVGTEHAQAVIERYIAEAMQYADVATLLVPSLPGLMKASDVMPRLDGVLLTGSPSNIEPWRYGDDAKDAEGPWDPGRDQMAADLVHAALDLGKPVFAICRGLQELNVVFGGTLRRDLGARKALPHHAPPGATLPQMFDHEHDVTLKPGGILERALGAQTIRVNSVHYQGIDRLGHGLSAEATAADGLVEGVSARVNGAPVVGVQWHPEWHTEKDAHSIDYFRLLGRAMRGELADGEERNQGTQK